MSQAAITFIVILCLALIIGFKMWLDHKERMAKK